MRTDVWSGVDVDRLDTLCRRYGISTLCVFGSVARGEAASASDVDLLYTSSPERVWAGRSRISPTRW